MPTHMSAKEAQDNFSDVLNRAFYRNAAIVVERQGKPVAVVISPDQFAALQQSRQEFWTAVDQIRERNRAEDPDEVLRHVTEIVEEVRQERHARRQHSTN